MTYIGRIWLPSAEYDLHWLIVTLTGRICSQSKVFCSVLPIQYTRILPLLYFLTTLCKNWNKLTFCFDAILLLVIGVIMFTWNLWQCVIVVSFVNDLLLINNWWICYNGSCKSLQYRGTCIRLRVSAMKPSSRLWISCGMWNAERKMRNDGDWSTCHTTWPQLLRSYRNPRDAGAVANCVMQMWKVALCACYFNLPNMFIWKLSRNDINKSYG